jgi:hypothetical protein
MTLTVPDAAPRYHRRVGRRRRSSTNSEMTCRPVPNWHSPARNGTLKAMASIAAYVAGPRCSIRRRSSTPAPAGQASPSRWQSKTSSILPMRLSASVGRRCHAHCVRLTSGTYSMTARRPAERATVSTRFACGLCLGRRDDQSPTSVQRAGTRRVPQHSRQL